VVDVLCGNRSFTYVKSTNRFERMDSIGRDLSERSSKYTQKVWYLLSYSEYREEKSPLPKALAALSSRQTKDKNWRKTP